MTMGETFEIETDEDDGMDYEPAHKLVVPLPNILDLYALKTLCVEATHLMTGIGRFHMCAPVKNAPSANLARQIAMYLMHTVFGKSQKQVAIAFRRRQPTVQHAVKSIEERRDYGEFDEVLEAAEGYLYAINRWRRTRT